MSRSRAMPLPRDPRPHRKVGSSVRAGMIWSLPGAIFGSLLWLVSKIFSVDYTVWTRGGPDGGGTEVVVGPLSIIGASILAGLLAGLLAGIAAKFIARITPGIIVGGGILILASCTLPLEQPDSVATSTRIILLIMHLVTGAFIVFGLAKGLRSDDKAVTT